MARGRSRTVFAAVSREPGVVHAPGRLVHAGRRPPGVWFTYPGILRDTWVSSRIPDPGPNTFTFSRSCKVVRHTARYLVVLSDSTQKTAHAKTFQSAREAAPSTQSSHIHRRHARQDLCRFNQPDTTPQPQVRRRRRRVRRRSTRTLRRARVRRRSVQRARLMP